VEFGDAQYQRYYQSSHWMTHGCPIAAGDRHDLPGLIDERIPGIAAVVHNIVERFEYSVRQPALAHELPDVFLALSSGARGGSGIKELTIRAGTFSCKETFGLNRLLQRNRSGAFTSGTPL
jgi:hypothetical protein